MRNKTIYHLYPDIADNHKAEYYAMVSEPGDGTATLFSWGVPIYTIRISDKKIIYKDSDMDSKEKKWLSDFKKLIENNSSYTDLTHCLYFNNDIVEYSEDGAELFHKLYQMLEDAKANNDSVDISGCYLTRVPTVIYKDGFDAEFLWDDEYKYFGLTKLGTTIDDVLAAMDGIMNKYK